jgi:hypothetical protein
MAVFRFAWVAGIRLGGRVLRSRHRIGLGILAVAVTLAAGCSDLGDPASAQSLTRNDLVAELAAQLASSASLTYVATYQLAGGATATITQAQDPLRAAYRYPGGEVLVTGAATTRCVKQTCTMTAPATPPPAGTFADARKAGLITPAAVEDLLNAARMDPDLTVAQHDTTAAGRHATCVKLGNVDAARAGSTTPEPSGPAGNDSASSPSTASGPTPSGSTGATIRADEVGVSPAGAFSTCITSDGIVGSFTGTLNGTAVDVALTNYNDQVTGDAFDPPPAAKMVDHRTK